MMVDRPEVEPSLLEVRRKLALTDLEKTYDIALSLFKWFATTILALNGAALLAGLSSEQFAATLLAGPAWLFVAGIVLSLGSGLALTRSFADSGQHLFEAFGNKKVSTAEVMTILLRMRAWGGLV